MHQWWNPPESARSIVHGGIAMASACSACGAALEGGEKFCGGCGALVGAVAPPAHVARAAAQPASAVHRAPGARKLNVLPAIVAVAALAAGGYYFYAQQAGPPAAASVSGASTPPAAVSSSTPPPSSSVQSGPPSAATAQGSTLAASQDAFAAEIEKTYADAGIAAIAPLRLTLAGCAACQPMLIYCADSLSDASQLRGRKVRAVMAATEAHALIEASGGSLTPLPFPELRLALQTGVIDCAIGGGGPMQ
jgi:hypothetical protein